MLTFLVSPGLCGSVIEFLSSHGHNAVWQCPSLCCVRVYFPELLWKYVEFRCCGTTLCEACMPYIACTNICLFYWYFIPVRSLLPSLSGVCLEMQIDISNGWKWPALGSAWENSHLEWDCWEKFGIPRLGLICFPWASGEFWLKQMMGYSWKSKRGGHCFTVMFSWIISRCFTACLTMYGDGMLCSVN